MKTPPKNATVTDLSKMSSPAKQPHFSHAESVVHYFVKPVIQTRKRIDEKDVYDIQS
jgi:hypothetical protein